MTPRQFLRQVRYLLATATYQTSPNDLVFGSVRHATQIPLALLQEMRFPAALVVDDSFEPHAEHPLLREQKLRIVLLVRMAADPFGEKAMIGGHRDLATGSATGRGLLEIQAEALRIISQLDRDDGIHLQLGVASTPAPLQADGVDAVVYQELPMRGWMYATASYPAATSLVLAQVGANVTVTWTNPPARFDRVAMKADVVRKANSAPTSRTDGTVLSTAATSPLTDSAPGAGTWYYGVWPQYDDDEDATADSYADAGLTGSITVT